MQTLANSPTQGYVLTHSQEIPMRPVEDPLNLTFTSIAPIPSQLTHLFWLVPEVATSSQVLQCVTACSQFGYNYAGMKYGRECFFGNNRPSSGLLTTSSDYPAQEKPHACVKEAGDTQLRDRFHIWLSTNPLRTKQ
ncbi:hypothetical protein F5Y19DRAFT_470555 [Xylariaceae sp. FL1651]|nr:hypothetical protein F5Y19DRAFT_470555 [Xylariaceae sp. FL1651]